MESKSIRVCNLVEHFFSVTNWYVGTKAISQSPHFLRLSKSPRIFPATFVAIPLLSRRSFFFNENRPRRSFETHLTLWEVTLYKFAVANIAFNHYYEYFPDEVFGFAQNFGEGALGVEMALHLIVRDGFLVR